MADIHQHTPARVVPSTDERNVARRRARGERERSVRMAARARLEAMVLELGFGDVPGRGE